MPSLMTREGQSATLPSRGKRTVGRPIASTAATNQLRNVLIFGLSSGMSLFGGPGVELSSEQLAELFGLSRSHVYTCRRAGQRLMGEARDAG